VEVEIVHVNLDYNLLLGQNWLYAMDVFVSYLFCICFPHEKRIIMVNLLPFSTIVPNSSSNSTISLVKNDQQLIENLGVGMYSSLMGTFDLLPLVEYINGVSSSKVLIYECSFSAQYFTDP